MTRTRTDLETVAGLADAIRAGTTSAADAVEQSLNAVRDRDAHYEAFRETVDDAARARAADIDRRLAAGDPVGPLAGVPVGIKDNIATRAGHTSCGSRMLESYVSPYDATVVERLEAAGAIVIGKTNCDEFAMGSSTEHCAFATPRNPWDTSRVPGGSSGGSAAAVAGGLCPAALGSDTGGSIRQPAAFCGIVGLKPTYGRVSRSGLVAFGSSLDQIGPMTHTVRDAAMVLEAIAGVDPRDATSIDLPPSTVTERFDEPVNGLRVGVPRQYLADANDPAVNASVRAAMETFASLGAEIIEDIDLPLTDHGIATYYVIAPAEASSNLARYDGIRYGHRATLEPGEDLLDLYAKSRAEGFGPEVQRRIMLGTYVLSAGYYDAYYKRALQARRLIKNEFDVAFTRCHVILGPTTPTPAFTVGGISDPMTMYLNDVYTANTNIAGICGISLPGGFAEVGGRRLPLGIQLQAQAFDEATLLRTARMFEDATVFNQTPPDPSSE